MSIFNLIGVNNSLSKIIIFIVNIIIFFIYGFNNGKASNKKGITEGAINGIILISILFFISIIFFPKSLSLGTLLYYLVLLVTSIISGIIGKNKKENPTSDKT